MKRVQRGFSIMEAMLSMALLAAVLAYALQLSQAGEDQAVGRNNADALSSFSQLAGQYFLANRAAMEAAMKDGTDAAKYCKIDVAADGTGGTVANSVSKHTCALDATMLRAQGLWPQAMSTSTMGGRYVGIFRLVHDSGGEPTGVVDAIFVLASLDGTLQPATQDARRLEEMATGQNSLGGIGGVVPVGRVGDCVTSRVSSTFQVCGNGWKLNLADFIDPAQMTTFANALPN